MSWEPLTELFVMCANPIVGVVQCLQQRECCSMLKTDFAVFVAFDPAMLVVGEVLWITSDLVES